MHAALLEENRILKEQLENLQAQVTTLASSPAAHRQKLTRLDTGREVAVADHELAAMRQIFSLFDVDKNGKVSPSSLKMLHQKLGEPITEEEATAAVAELGSLHGGHYFTFDDFLAYWDGKHPSQRRVPTASSEADGAGSSAHDAAAASEEGTLSPHFGSHSSTAAAVITGNGAFLTNTAAETERQRQWYQARFKFVKAKIANPAVGRIYAVEHGPCPSLEYRVRFYQDDESGKPVQISCWHDVPYKNGDGTYNMIVEIPKWSRRKYEIATGEEFNPIKQDTKNGVLREYNYGDMLFNYGAIPQTWENPHHKHPATGASGDNDPIDAIDIGNKRWGTGSIVRVKVLGVLAMIDSGETDWKLICINVEDPLAHLLHDIEDVYVHMPGAVEAFHHWMKHYKTPSINEFAFEGKCQPRKFAESILEETHVDWVKLVEERRTVSK